MIYLALCAGEAGMFLALLSLYQAAIMPDSWSFLRSSPLFLSSSIIIVFSLGWAIHILRKCAPTNKRTVYLWMGMNLVMLVLILGSVEILGRFLVKTFATGQAHHAGERVLERIQYLRNWPHFAAKNKQMIDRMAHEGSYLEYDRILGWTIAPSHSDKESGLYFSSAEGLRSPRGGMSFADLRARHSNVSEQPASVRIALIGDSMAYGHEVRYEESWGHVLETLMQPHIQVLNFAVPAHGLDQTMLRYEKDVRPWKPQIVVIGIYSQMVERITNIYTFLKDPLSGLPFARPQWVIKNSIPTPIYDPVPDPEQIFAHTAISELPYVDLDDYYRPFQWERGGLWYLLERSYLFRFAYSFWLPSDDREEERTQNTLQMGQFMIQYLVREVLEDGAIPLVVYLPDKEELRISKEPQSKYIPLSARMLHNADIEYFDPTDCLSRVEASEAFMKGGHYSPQANSQLAHCLEPVLRGMIGGLNGNPHVTSLSAISKD